MPFRRGLVVGKFAPLHRGHMLVIERAASACDELVILSYSNPEFPGCEPGKRERWLTTLFPRATILVVADNDTPLNDALDDVHRRFCAEVLLEQLGLTVDAVFTSEDYGDGFAAVLTREFRRCDPRAREVAHVSVDRGRTAVPISGTQMRADIHAHRTFLHPKVYADFVERVCFLGAESTGKSTLAAALAREFGTTHVEEFGRELWEQRGGQLRFDDYRTIVETQIAREEAACRDERTNRFVFCDTSPLTTLLYQRHDFGRVDPFVEDAARMRTYAHTFLCAPDFPLVQDGTRRDEAFRDGQHAAHLTALTRSGVSFEILRGTLAKRFAHGHRILAAHAPAPAAES